MRGSSSDKLHVVPERKRWTEDDARRVLAAWSASGNSLGEFSRGAGLEPQRLERWCKRLGIVAGIEPKPSSTEARAVRPAFVPAKIIAASAADSKCAAVVSCGELRIEIHNTEMVPPAWLAELVSSLGMVRP